MTPRLVRGTWVSGGTAAEFCSTAEMMRAIVRTASSGYLPTEVSPDSITASAPSSTALATSEASARVGREFSIIDSSIWVATMTGLAFSRAIWMARFWTSGTCFERQLDAEVAARHHDRVEGEHDRLEVVDRLRLLQLGDHRHPRATRLPSRRGRARRRRVTARTTTRRGRHPVESRARGPRRPCRTSPAPTRSYPAATFPCCC